MYMSKQGSTQSNNTIHKTNQIHLAAMHTGKATQWGEKNSQFLILLLHRYCASDWFYYRKFLCIIDNVSENTRPLIISNAIYIIKVRLDCKMLYMFY
jgi:hypothetical protein